MRQRLRGTLIIPKRLQQARLARGMSVSELSDLVGVSRQMITRYESGASMPSPEVCFRLAQELRVPVGYFSKPLSEQDSAGPVYFRKAAATTARLQFMIEQRAQWLVDVVKYLEEYVDLPVRDLPNFEHVERPDDGWNFDMIDELANETRKAWGLGLGPIRDLTALLEYHGIIIGRLSSTHQHLDACSWLTREHAFILLESSKTAVRERFDLAHELGHLVLHSGIEPGDIADKSKHRKLEDEAHRFASAFLMPAETFGAEVAVPSLSHLQFMKSRWKVSIQAMLHRLHDLELIDDFTYRSLYRQISARRWNRFEPLDDEIPRENPSLLRESIELLLEHEVKTPEGILEDLQLPQDEVEALCGLPQGTLNPRKTGVSIKRVK